MLGGGGSLVDLVSKLFGVACLFFFSKAKGKPKPSSSLVLPFWGGAFDFLKTETRGSQTVYDTLGAKSVWGCCCFQGATQKENPETRGSKIFCDASCRVLVSGHKAEGLPATPG